MYILHSGTDGKQEKIHTCISKHTGNHASCIWHDVAAPAKDLTDGNSHHGTLMQEAVLYF